jgi:hypothetical protein
VCLPSCATVSFVIAETSRAVVLLRLQAKEAAKPAEHLVADSAHVFALTEAGQLFRNMTEVNTAIGIGCSCSVSPLLYFVFTPSSTVAFQVKGDVYARKECHDSPWKLIAEDVVSQIAVTVILQFARWSALRSRFVCACCPVSNVNRLSAMLRPMAP